MIWPSCSLRISNIHASFSCVLFSQITHGTQSGFQFHEFHEDKPSDQLWRGNHRSLTPVLLRRSRCKSNSTLFRFSWMRDFGDPPTALPKRGMDRTINVVCRVLSKAGRSDDSPSWCEEQNFMEPMNWACSLVTWSRGECCRRRESFMCPAKENPIPSERVSHVSTSSLDESELWLSLHAPKESIQPI